MQVNFFTLDCSFQSMVDCSVEQGHESKSEKPDDNVLECHPVFRAFIHDSRRQFNSPCFKATGLKPLVGRARLQPPHSAGLFTMSQ